MGVEDGGVSPSIFSVLRVLSLLLAQLLQEKTARLYPEASVNPVQKVQGEGRAAVVPTPRQCLGVSPPGCFFDTWNFKFQLQNIK